MICIYNKNVKEQNRDEAAYNKHHVILIYIANTNMLNGKYAYFKTFYVYMYTFSLLYFRIPKYEPKNRQNLGTKKYGAFYAAERYSIALAVLGLLQSPFLKPFSKVRNYINRNTYMNM